MAIATVALLALLEHPIAAAFSAADRRTSVSADGVTVIACLASTEDAVAAQIRQAHSQIAGRIAEAG